MGQKIALGQAVPQAAKSVITKPMTLEERVIALEQRLEDLTRAYFMEVERRSDLVPDETTETRDGVPVGSCLKGVTRGQPYWLTVEKDGFFVGIHKYKSLSAAAEAVSGVRRSGWTFWCTADGRTAKEAFGK
jgi:hypothetical protein